MHKRIESIPEETIEALCEYSWPGNVRELRNVVERAMILCKGTTLRIVPPQIAAGPAPGGAGMTLAEVERGHVLRVLEQARWRVRGSGGAASVLGLKPTTLEARMRRLGIERPK
jgi:transcriptional regulator with GAF, ATPase, and Fis domain